MSATLRTPSQRLMMAPALPLSFTMPFRVEQHVRLLRRLPLQTHAGGDGGPCAVGDLATHGVTP